MCKIAGVSKSGYYKFFSKNAESSRIQREILDEVSRENVLKTFNFKNRKKGARQIKMVLQNHFNLIYNLKRIRRIMKKYNIICPIRKANPYRRMMKATKEHTVMPNLLNREFKQKTPGELHNEAYIHSDQGVHYTSPKVQKLIQKFGLSQSMSIRGNFRDNTPQESFFGHFKDEVDLKKCQNLNELKIEIDNYMSYYNNYRYQWNLNKMTPVQYRNHLIT